VGYDPWLAATAVVVVAVATPVVEPEPVPAVDVVADVDVVAAFVVEFDAAVVAVCVTPVIRATEIAPAAAAAPIPAAGARRRRDSVLPRVVIATTMRQETSGQPHPDLKSVPTCAGSRLFAA
jgi:hypothetical protein